MAKTNAVRVLVLDEQNAAANPYQISARPLTLDVLLDVAAEFDRPYHANRPQIIHVSEDEAPPKGAHFIREVNGQARAWKFRAGF